MAKNYCVYKHTLKRDGRVYIGITSKKPHQRWGKNGSGYTICTRFYNAIKKYGWDNFDHEILEEGLSEEEAKEAEIKLISEYHSVNPKFGFNIKPGGDLPSELQFKKVNVYDLDGKYIKTYDGIIIASQDLMVNVNSIIQCCKLQDYNHSVLKKYLFRYLSEDFPKDVDLPNKYNEFIKKSRRVCVYDYDGKFIEIVDDVKTIINKYNVNESDVYNCCNLNPKNKIVGYNIFRWYQGDSNFNDLEVDFVPKKRNINRYRLDGKYIDTFLNIKDASKKTGIDSASIGKCCNLSPKNCKAGGYIFRFKNKEFPIGVDIESYETIKGKINGKKLL